MRNRDSQKYAKGKEEWACQKQPEPMKTWFFSHVWKVGEHFVIPCFQDNKHDQWESKDNIGNNKGVWQDVKYLTAFEIDGNGLV